MANTPLQEFISAVNSRGLARENRFLVTFDRGIPDELRFVQLFCDTASLPGVNIASTPATTYGETREMPYSRTFNEIQLSFYLDADMSIKKFFDDWKDAVINPITRSPGYYNDYTRTVRVQLVDFQADNEGKDMIPYTVVLWEAWIKSIGDINLNTSGTSIIKLPVTLNYKYWTSENTPVNRNTPAVALNTVGPNPLDGNTDVVNVGLPR